MTAHPSRPDLIAALKRLTDVATQVAHRGATTGPQWIRLNAALAEARAALASEPEPVAEGWVTVPKEPTPEMIGAGLIENSDDPDHEASSVGHQWVRQAIYEAMIAASPHLAEEKKP